MNAQTTDTSPIEGLITEHIDIWSSAIKRRSSSGRGSNKKIELYGIKKLRELILELAVRGKLVPQNPNDEPASILLERIAQEKAQLVKEGKIKKPKKLPEISEEEKPFELLEGWEWCRLGDVTNYGECDKAEANDVTASTWVLELEDVEKETSRLLKVVRFSERQFKSSKNVFKSGDVIYGKLRPYLDKVIVADEQGVCTTEMIPVRGYKHLLPSYLRLVMKSPRFILYANESTHGMNLPRMGTDKARLALVPLCSEIQQNLIVEKVDELMALCDQLEEQTDFSLDAHQTLVTVLLDTLVNSQNAEELAENWTRISGHFDSLFTTEQSIDQLKQTIMQLAVMGNLVPFGEVVNVKLKDLLAFGPKNGFSAKEVSYETELKVLKLGATSYGELNVEESKFIDENISSDSHLWLKPDDILIQRGNSSNFVGSNIIIKKECIGYIYPDLMMKIRANELIEPSFLSLTLSAPNTREFLWSRMTGTSGTMPKISKSIVESIPIKLPRSRETQRAIVVMVDLLIKTCDELKLRCLDAQMIKIRLADEVVNRGLI
ncbi:restriction endonuclease subunit S [Marinomonas algicola]|uniref:restriction endonuclease subunit S n=1 Tax=Marinomonas algicola TaxID=2773454 RepID=UPI0019D5C013|nr:restriction endonuclease subunit S [Marinomonas algicola]